MVMLMYAPYFPISVNNTILIHVFCYHRTPSVILRISWALRLSSGSMTRSTGELGPWSGTPPSPRSMLMLTGQFINNVSAGAFDTIGAYSHTRIEQFHDAGSSELVSTTPSQ